ncbi:MAG: NUDIX domain-containing protein [Candidatus Nanohaloarchaea archaeon]
MKEAAIAVPRDPATSEYLVLRRSPDKDRFPGKWGFAGGTVKDGETVEDAALRELREETGLDGEVVRRGPPYVEADGERFRVHPFLVHVPRSEVELDDEHDAHRWTDLDTVRTLDTVADLEGLRQLEVLD